MSARVYDAIHVKVKIVKLDAIRIGFWGVLRYGFPIVSIVLLKQAVEVFLDAEYHTEGFSLLWMFYHTWTDIDLQYITIEKIYGKWDKSQHSALTLTKYWAPYPVSYG